MNQELHFKTHIPSKNLFQNWSPFDNLNKFGHHLMIPKWRPKMLTNPFIATEIHSHHLMQPNFSWCHCMATEFSHHAIVVIENLLVAKPMWQPKGFRSSGCLTPPPTPRFFPLLHFPPLMVIETILVTILVAILCDPFIKKWGY
jgi:hypothetical protein